MNLHVIEGIKKEKPDYFGIYNRVFVGCIQKVKESSLNLASEEVDLDTRKKIIYYGVKMVNAAKRDAITVKERKSLFSLTSAIIDMIKLITPNDFENIFPIVKTYNGEKFETKDYFFTKKMIKEIGENNLIGENVDKFLWDYQNWAVTFFLIEMMSAVDDIRRSEGKKGAIEEFFEEKGLATYTMYEDEKGKKHIVNNQTNEVTEVKKPKPRYLNLVKEKAPIPDQEN